jgi:hypothetical protein
VISRVVYRLGKELWSGRKLMVDMDFSSDNLIGSGNNQEHISKITGSIGCRIQSAIAGYLLQEQNGNRMEITTKNRGE